MNRRQQLAAVKRMRKLLAKPDAWCKGYEAIRRDSFGASSTSPKNPSASSWCLLGAAKRCRADTQGHHECLRWASTEPLVQFNDAPETTHRDVLRFLDACIKKLEGK